MLKSQFQVGPNLNASMHEQFWFSLRYLIVQPIILYHKNNISICKLGYSTGIQHTRTLRRQFSKSTISKKYPRGEANRWFILWAPNTHLIFTYPKLKGEKKLIDSSVNKMSSDAAEKKCREIGGHLPMIKTDEDEEHLLAVLLGRLAPSELYMAPCKYVSPICHVFIGMNPSKVRVIFYAPMFVK